MRVTDKQPELQVTCETCHKPIGNAKGSLTSWLFSDKRCSCTTEQTAQTSAVRVTQLPENTQVDAELTAQLGLDGRYQVCGVICEGGMGTVYRVYDTALGALFAVKVLKPQLTSDAASLKRFNQEAIACSALTHPNIAAVYSHGTTQHGSPFLVMDLIQGETLEQLLQREVYLDPQRALRIFIQIAEALEHAHRKGIVHRDVKPSNILLSSTESGVDFVKLVDFGIAKVRAAKGAETLLLTQTDEMYGTPTYMSPEQCTGGTLDARSDIYSLGCVMYEVLCGKPPFEEANPIKTIFRHVNEDVRPLSEAFKHLEIPADVDSVITHCLEKSPEQRYRNATELLHDLKLIEEHKPVKLRQASQRVELVHSGPLPVKKRIGAAIIDQLVLGFLLTVFFQMVLRIYFTLDRVDTLTPSLIDMFFHFCIPNSALTECIFPIMGSVIFGTYIATDFDFAPWLWIMPTLMFIAYHWFANRTPWSATLGERVCGLVMVTNNGYKPSLVQLAIHHAAGVLWFFDLIYVWIKSVMQDKPFKVGIREVLATPIPDRLSRCRPVNRRARWQPLLLVPVLLIITPLMESLNGQRYGDFPKRTIAKASDGVTTIETIRFWRGRYEPVQTLKIEKRADGSQSIVQPGYILTKNADRSKISIEQLDHGEPVARLDVEYVSGKGDKPAEQITTVHFPNGVSKVFTDTGKKIDSSLRDAEIVDVDWVTHGEDPYHYVLQTNTMAALQKTLSYSSFDFNSDRAGRSLFPRIAYGDFSSGYSRAWHHSGFYPVVSPRSDYRKRNSDDAMKLSVVQWGQVWYGMDIVSRNYPGECSQRVYTMPGAKYRVEFDVSGYKKGDPIKKLRVEAAGKSQDFEFDASSQPEEAVRDFGRGIITSWSRKQFDFVADKPFTTVLFRGMNAPEVEGAIIDNVTMKRLPD